MKLSARVGALERVPGTSLPLQARCGGCGTSPVDRVRQRIDQLLTGVAGNVGCERCQRDEHAKADRDVEAARERLARRFDRLALTAGAHP